MMFSRRTTRNRLLSSLSEADFALLQPMLTATELPVRKRLQSRGRQIENAYFPESGLASVVVSAGNEHAIEVGLIGREGVTGLALIMGAGLSPNNTFMQVAGMGWSLARKDLLHAMRESSSLRNHLILYAHTFMVQMSFTALSDGRFKLDERLARWLLMTQDRLESDTIAMTHEFLAVMLGVRRAGVTVALKSLEKREIVLAKRRSITILDRSALIAAANGGYGVPEAEFDRCFGTGADHKDETSFADAEALL